MKSMYYYKKVENSIFPDFDSENEFIFHYKVLNESSLKDTILKRYYRNFIQNYNDLNHFIEERIRVNGKIIRANDRIDIDDFIQYRHRKSDEAKLKKLKIIFENDHFIVIDKEANQPFSPAIPVYFNAIVKRLKQELSLKKVYPIHRLDTDTSGVLLIGKRKEAASSLSKVFHNQEVEKYYKTIVYGRVDESIRKIEGKIVKDKSCFTFSKWKLIDNEKPDSITLIENLKTLSGCSELTLKPLTGRTNQIRVHMSSIGHPIVGDKKYYYDQSVYRNWFEKNIVDRKMILNTYILNCSKMLLNDPMSNQEMLFESDQEDYQEKKEEILKHNYH